MILGLGLFFVVIVIIILLMSHKNLDMKVSTIDISNYTLMYICQDVSKHLYTHENVIQIKESGKVYTIHTGAGYIIGLNIKTECKASAVYIVDSNPHIVIKEYFNNKGVSQYYETELYLLEKMIDTSDY